MSADMEGLRRKGRAIAELLTAGSQAQITCPNGSDLTIGLEGRTGIPDAGELTEPGAFGNLPCGEGFIAPVEGTTEGRLVVDGTIATVGLGGEPVELVVQRGHLVSASGQRGERLMELLTAAGPGGTNVAELGIGTNEKAILSGEILEDEKLLGTAHVAFGASAAIGGTVQVPIHLDCLVTKPDVTVDGELVVRNGVLVV
jgi:leucyl aminopeptidase (aminopeptidase T)